MHIYKNQTSTVFNRVKNGIILWTHTSCLQRFDFVRSDIKTLGGRWGPENVGRKRVVTL